MKKILTKIDSNKIYRTIPVNLIYLVPCYNESQTELTDTLDSLSEQLSTQPQDKKLLIIICDGKVKGSGNNKKTSKIITEDILNNNNKTIILDAYQTWDKTNNNLDIYTGKYKNLDYILLIKEKNYGKRDSLVLIRRLIYCYNKVFNYNKYLMILYIYLFSFNIFYSLKVEI